MVRDFSKRHGYEPRPESLSRDGDCPALRLFVLRHLSQDVQGNVHHIRELVSKTLNYVPNPGNMMIAEVWAEIDSAVRRCPWFLLYNLVEEIYRMRGTWGQAAFLNEVNDFFYDHNLGWQLRAVPLEDFGGAIAAPEIVIRGDDAFERTLTNATNALNEAHLSDAKKELREAIADLSRRPDADVTGAVHHAVAALECAAAQKCGEEGGTLGQIAKRSPHVFPSPLGDAVNKFYGFASDRGRHVSEGKTPTLSEAEFVVAVSAALIAFVVGS